MLVNSDHNNVDQSRWNSCACYWSRRLVDMLQTVSRAVTFTTLSNLLNYSVSVFSFFLIFSVSMPCTGLSWPSRQLLSARKSTVSYRSYRIVTVSYCAGRVNSGMRNVTVWRPSVCLCRRHSHHDSPGAACDAASVR